MAILTSALAIGSALANIGSTLYNLWSNKRDADYQKVSSSKFLSVKILQYKDVCRTWKIQV